jgi:hypothetical protein
MKKPVRFQDLTAACMKMTALLDKTSCSLVEADRCFAGATASIIRVMMEAVGTSETSVYFNGTRRCYMPEGCNLCMNKQFSYCL